MRQNGAIDTSKEQLSLLVGNSLTKKWCASKHHLADDDDTFMAPLGR